MVRSRKLDALGKGRGVAMNAKEAMGQWSMVGQWPNEAKGSRKVQIAHRGRREHEGGTGVNVRPAFQGGTALAPHPSSRKLVPEHGHVSKFMKC